MLPNMENTKNRQDNNWVHTNWKPQYTSESLEHKGTNQKALKHHNTLGFNSNLETQIKLY